MPNHALASALLLLAAVAPVAVHACSWGDPSRPLQDEVHAYYDADVVFVAKVGAVDEFPPEPNFPYAMWAAPYEILEVYRGEPSTDGLIASEDRMKLGLYGTPPNSCTGGNLAPGYEGMRLLVFGHRKDREGRAMYRMDLSSMPLGSCAGCEDVLERLRLYGKFHQVNAGSR